MTRSTPLRLLSILAALAIGAVAFAGCGDDDDGGETTPAATAETETDGDEAGGMADEDGGGADGGKAGKDGGGTAIKLASSPVGDALFDGEDQAIYLFDIEKSSESECYGECAEEWPPVQTKGDPVAKGAIEQSLLGTTKRDDGTTQVTYNDHPLYYYAHEGAGELRCHNVPGFGGLWLALDESGDALS